MPTQNSIKIIARPDWEQTGIWAFKGTTAKPDLSKVESGWHYGEKPPFSVVNYLINRLDESVMYYFQRGIPEWSALTLYTKGSLIYHKDKYYIALNNTKENRNIEPGVHQDSDSYWSPAVFITDDMWTDGTNGGTAGTNTAANKFIKTDNNGFIDARFNASRVMNFHGELDFTKPIPPETSFTDLDNGAVFIAEASGPVDSSWKGLHKPGNGSKPSDPNYIAKGQSVVFHGKDYNDQNAKWLRLGSAPTAVDELLWRDGSKAMENGAQLTLGTSSPADDLHAASKGYVDTEISSAITNYGNTADSSFVKLDGSNAMTGDLTIPYNPTPNDDNAVTKKYVAEKLTAVDTEISSCLKLSGGTMTGDIDLGGNKIINVKSELPTAKTDIITAGSYAQEDFGGTVRIKVINGELHIRTDDTPW